MPKLTKAEILQGKNKTEEVYFKKLGGSIELTSLTDGELSEIEAIKTKGIKVKGNPDKQSKDNNEEVGMEFNIEDIQRNEFEGDVLAVKYSIVDNEEWSKDDIKQLPAGSVDVISKEVYRISGATPEGREKVKSFRG